MNKNLDGINYDIIHGFYKEVNAHPLVQGGHVVVEFETMYANESYIVLGFTIKTANKNMSFSVSTELGDYYRSIYYSIFTDRNLFTHDEYRL